MLQQKTVDLLPLQLLLNKVLKSYQISIILLPTHSMLAIKIVDELSVRICSSDGLSFVNNKGNANFVMIISY